MDKDTIIELRSDKVGDSEITLQEIQEQGWDLIDFVEFQELIGREWSIRGHKAQ